IVERFHVDRTIRRRDLAIDAAHPHISSIRSTQYEAKAAADSQIYVANYQRPSARSEPALEQLGLGEGVEDQVTRCVEDAAQDHFPVRRGSYRQASIVFHRCSPLLLGLRFFGRCISSSRTSRRSKLSS